MGSQEISNDRADNLSRELNDEEIKKANLLAGEQPDRSHVTYGLVEYSLLDKVRLSLVTHERRALEPQKALSCCTQSTRESPTIQAFGDRSSQPRIRNLLGSLSTLFHGGRIYQNHATAVGSQGFAYRNTRFISSNRKCGPRSESCDPSYLLSFKMGSESSSPPCFLTG